MRKDIMEVVSRCLVGQKVKNQIPKDFKHVTTFEDSQIEMGRYFDGFCGKTIEGSGRI